MEELKAKGTVMLKAKTHEELSAMIDEIPASVKYSAGAVGRSKDDGTLTLRIDLNE